MPDEQKNTGGDPADPKGQQPEGKKAEPKVPEMVTFTRHGKNVDLPYSKVLELAGRGLEAGEQAQRLTAREQALRADETNYAQYQQFRTAIQANPKLAQALDLATKDPDAILSPRDRAPAVEDEDPFADDEPRGRRAKAPRPSGPDPELAALRAEIAELRASNRSRDVRDTRDRIEREVDRAFGDHTWLEGKRLDMARRLVFAELSHGGTRPIDEVVGSVAAEIRAAETESDQRRLNQASEREILRTSPPNLGVPGIEPDRKFTAKELADGTVATQAANAIRKLLGRK